MPTDCERAASREGATVSLRDWQQSFMAALRDDVPARNAARVLQATPRSAAALDIHRNNSRSVLRNALRSAHPVVERLVGVDFFGYAADRFIDEQVSRSGNVEDYGAEFPEFLRVFAPARDLPYLADVAALEAAIDSVRIAPDAGAECLLQSPYPILRIWQVNQPGWSGDDGVDLGEGGDTLRIWRRDDDVVCEVLIEVLAGGGTQ